MYCHKKHIDHIFKYQWQDAVDTHEISLCDSLSKGRLVSTMLTTLNGSYLCPRLLSTNLESVKVYREGGELFIFVHDASSIIW